MYDKTMRLVSLAEYLGKVTKAAPQDIEYAKRSAYLSKADLSTNIVGEFSELQGIMGQEYAVLDGEKQEVAQAVFEHYLPRFAGDNLAKSVPGKLVGIADKIDNIAATFKRGLVPTGSQDPYALRRQALGIVNTLLEGKYYISLSDLIRTALDLLKVDDNARQTELTCAISDFFRLRLKNVFGDKNIKYDISDAVLASEPDDIYDVYKRAKALVEFIEEGKTDTVQKTLQALSRAGNLAKQAKDTSGEIDARLFKTEEEKNLYKAYSDARGKVGQYAAAKNYIAALNELLTLTNPIDSFFDSVMVMVDDMAVRENRLKLLKNITHLASEIADLNKLVLIKGE
jgi:glycyl-tRNA synthetase beta chain